MAVCFETASSTAGHLMFDLHKLHTNEGSRLVAISIPKASAPANPHPVQNG
jgi:hypothetical protein